MNKQDKKEIMNLIKYKNMLGGRIMNLEKMSIDVAEIWLKQVVKGGLADKETIKAINVVLDGLDTRYNKGYQDGFHSARYDKYINEIHGEGESAVKYLEIEKAGYLRGYQDGFKQAKFDCEMDKLDGRQKNGTK